ncbi:hypothetical protein BJ742DRAFT_860155 [Cladochytrium replicatum]|nr:hypothetical protein BJ742DRAFT_860155 [Cladochytrium replicatum]
MSSNGVARHRPSGGPHDEDYRILSTLFSDRAGSTRGHIDVQEVIPILEELNDLVPASMRTSPRELLRANIPTSAMTMSLQDVWGTWSTIRGNPSTPNQPSKLHTTFPRPRQLRRTPEPVSESDSMDDRRDVYEAQGESNFISPLSSPPSSSPSSPRTRLPMFSKPRRPMGSASTTPRFVSGSSLVDFDDGYQSASGPDTPHVLEQPADPSAAQGLEKMKNKLKRTEEQLSAQRVASDEQIYSLQVLLEEKKSDMASHKQTIKKLQRNEQELKKTINSLEKELDKLSSEMRDTNRKFREVKNDLDQKLEREEDLEGQLHLAQQDLEESTTRITEMQNSYDKTLAEAEAMQRNYADLQGKMMQTKEIMEALKRENDMLKQMERELRSGGMDRSFLEYTGEGNVSVSETVYDSESHHDDSHSERIFSADPAVVRSPSIRSRSNRNSTISVNDAQKMGEVFVAVSNQLAGMKAEAERMADLEDEVSRLTLENAALAKQVYKLRANVDSLRDSIARRNKDDTESSTVLPRLQERLLELERNMTQAKETIESQSLREQQCLQTINQLERELSLHRTRNGGDTHIFVGQDMAVQTDDIELGALVPQQRNMGVVRVIKTLTSPREIGYYAIFSVWYLFTGMGWMLWLSEMGGNAAPGQVWIDGGNAGGGPGQQWLEVTWTCFVYILSIVNRRSSMQMQDLLNEEWTRKPI